MMNRIKFTSGVLYRLKRRHGQSIDLYHKTTQEINTITGKRIITKVKYSIKKAIMLPSQVALKYIDLSGGSQKFSYGGFIESDTKVYIIESKYVKGLDFNNVKDFYIVEENKRYDVNEIKEIENHKSLIVIAKHIRNGTVDKIVDLTIKTKLEFIQTSTGVK